MNTFPEFHKYDGLGLAELVHTKQISVAELIEEAISRIEAHNPKINAVIYKMYAQARKAAQSKLPDGPFKGVPFPSKGHACHRRRRADELWDAHIEGHPPAARQ